MARRRAHRDASRSGSLAAWRRALLLPRARSLTERLLTRCSSSLPAHLSMRGMRACASVRCSTRTPIHTVAARCRPAQRPMSQMPQMRSRPVVEQFLRAPRCAYSSEGNAQKPPSDQQSPKPAAPKQQQQQPDHDLVEEMLKAQREAILSRTSKRDSAKHLAPISWWSVGFLAIIAAAITYLLHEEEEQRKRSRKPVGTAKIGGSWTLVDMNGVPRTDHEFRGQFQLIYFGFTFCPDICPVELKKICDVVDEIDAKGLGKYLQPLFITVDPQRDSVHQIREYLKEFHPRLLGLTGTPEQLKECARAFRVYSMPGLEADVGSPDYLVDHSVIIYLMGPDNKLAQYFASRQSAAEIARLVEDHVLTIAPQSVYQRLKRTVTNLIERR